MNGNYRLRRGFGKTRGGRALLGTCVALLGVLVALPGVAHATTDGGQLPGTTVTVADGPGNQTDPHVSGSLVSYTTDEDYLDSSWSTRIKYHDLATGVRGVVPYPDGARDLLSDVSGSKIAFTRVDGLGSTINVYDVVTGTTTRLADPAQIEQQQSNAAIGGGTVVYEDTSDGSREIYVHDLSSGVQTRLTPDDKNNVSASVSPNGDVVVWASCHNGGCDLQEARRTEGVWSAPRTVDSATTTDYAWGRSATDGTIVAYARDGALRWQPVGGGPESSVPVSASIQAVEVADGVILFEGWNADVQDTDLHAYDTSTDVLYSVTQTPGRSETLPDIAARSDGSFVVTWAAPNATNTNLDLFALVTPPEDDRAPDVTINSPAPDTLFQLGTPVDVAASFSDGGPGTHTCSVTWDDGSPPSSGTITASSGGGTCAATHDYADAGVYTIAVTVTDAQGASDTETVDVVVYDPSAGFVTGAGWIDSPAGAYAADPAVADKAHFGFVSQYKKGASTPTGNSDFRFDAAGLKFQSSSYDWLVVSGPKAQYKGSGALNGVDGYRFLLTVNDGEATGGGGADAFRIKIWEAVTGDVVYDNQMGAGDDADASTTLGGGQIIIHRK